MSALSQIAANIQTISDKGGSPSDIEKYLGEEGMSKDEWLANWRHYNEEGGNVRDTGVTADLATGLRNFNSAVTLGWSNKAEAAANAAISKLRGNTADFGDLYKHSYDSIKQDIADLHSQHPVAAGYASAAGSMLPVAATMGAAAPEVAAAEAPSMLSTVGRSAGIGGGVGAVAGAGNAPAGSSPLEELRNTAAGANLGGAEGTAVGGILPLLLAGGSRLLSGGSRILDSLKGNSLFTPTVTKLSDLVAQSRTALASRGMIAPPSGSPPLPPSAPMAGGSADRQILRALGRDNLTPSDLQARLAANAGGPAKPEGIADLAAGPDQLGGDATRRLARSVYTQPGPGASDVSQAIQSRNQGQLGRMTSDVEQGLGSTGGQDPDSMVSDLIQQRSANAKPLYAKAEAHGEVNDPSVIGQLWGQPAFARAHADASRELNAVKGEQIDPLYNDQGQLARVPTVRDIDLIKKGIDSRLYNNQRGTIDPTDAISAESQGHLKMLRGNLLDATDAAVPDYKAARASYAGDTSVMEALDSGRGILSADDRTVAGQVNAMSDAERKAFQIGASDAITQKMRSLTDLGSKGAFVRSIFGSDVKRAAIRNAFGNDAKFGQFESSMRREASMDSTGAFVKGGSQTANKEADVTDSMVDAAHDVGSHGVVRGVYNAGARVADGILQRNSEGTRQQIGQRLFMSGGPALDDYLSGLEALHRARADRAAGVAAVAPGASAATTDDLLSQ